MDLKVKLDEGAYLPNRAHETDAGADLFTPRDIVIAPHRSATVDTGVHVELLPNTVGMLKSKSGLNVRYGVLSEGVIDEGYSGSIVVKLYNHSDAEITLVRGTKISQLVVLPVLYPRIVQVDEIGAGERGDAGFGSTDSITREDAMRVLEEKYGITREEAEAARDSVRGCLSELGMM